MKVSDLIEGEEWENKPFDLKHLYKKQLSATHAFMVEVDKQLQLRKLNNKLYNGVTVELRILSRYNLSRRSSEQIGSDINVKMLGMLGIPSLEQKYNKMYDAKYRYEQAGGSYEWPLPE